MGPCPIQALVRNIAKAVQNAHAHPAWSVPTGGLLALDVSEPYNPKFVGCYGDDGYTHDAQCVVYHGPDTEHVGKEVSGTSLQCAWSPSTIFVQNAPCDLFCDLFFPGLLCLQ